MKIEFCKEKSITGEFHWYFTRKDGRFVSNSLSSEKDVAEKRFEAIVEDSKNEKQAFETLKSVEV